MIQPDNVAVTEAPRFIAIAMIDDGLAPMCMDTIPEHERAAVAALLTDVEVLSELAERGMTADAVAQAPDSAIDALTQPDHELGLAYAKIAGVSDSAGRMIERRQTMRRIADSIRTTGTCEVKEFGPGDDLSDIARFDVVFIDYYLNDKEADGTRAEEIASVVQEKREPARNQQIVLMSTKEGVRALRTEFRKIAKIDAAAFGFVAKGDLDEDWKVKAHLDMLARGMQHSSALGDYISAVKTTARSAAEALSAAIDDLDIGDFAYIQRIALHADGHPLGDYLSWLLSSHLTSLAFEGVDLRARQAVVDAMEFADGPLSPAEPSVSVASLYHNALFARNLGPLSGHPRAIAGSPVFDVPFVQLGDVFLTAGKDRAVVVLSPDCDLAFSTDSARQPDRDLGVLLVFGDPNAVSGDLASDADATTEGMVDGAEVYRIDWRFNTFQTVRLGDLTTFLAERGFDLSKRDRLRPIYSLKLQHELGSHLMRVGPPIMPPIAKLGKGRIILRKAGGHETIGLDDSEIVISRFKNRSSVRLTPSLISKIKRACQDTLEDVAAKLESLPEDSEKAAKDKRNFRFKVDALADQLEGSDVWIGLLGDHPLPVGEPVRLRGAVYLAPAGQWNFPSEPAVVLVIGKEVEAEPDADGSADSPKHVQAAQPASVKPAAPKPSQLKGR